MLASQTLGAEDDYGVLYEQHNPDYIPAGKGGPAVLVSDSHNNRVVEYEWRAEEWVQTWEWSDGQLEWPRDADRLPNGHTLIVDSNGGRIIEINTDGDIIWKIELKSAYDAERLGTGDKSRGGNTASDLGLESRAGSTAGRTAPGGDGAYHPLRAVLRGVIPPKVRSSVVFVAPSWMGWTDIVAVGVILSVVGIWTIIEVYWWKDRIRLQAPVKLDR